MRSIYQPSGEKRGLCSFAELLSQGRGFAPSAGTDRDMMGIYILLGGIALCAVVITTLDWWATRQQRERAHRHGDE